MEIIFGRIVWIFLVRLIFLNDFVSADWLVLMAFSRLTFAIKVIKLFAYKYKCLWNVRGKRPEFKSLGESFTHIYP